MIVILRRIIYNAHVATYVGLGNNKKYVENKQEHFDRNIFRLYADYGSFIVKEVAVFAVTKFFYYSHVHLAGVTRDRDDDRRTHGRVLFLKTPKPPPNASARRRPPI